MVIEHLKLNESNKLLIYRGGGGGGGGVTQGE
jgi:hypothetical protein